MARVSAAVSWLLVKLIGRALGLIYRGVKQSLTQQPKPKQSTQNSGSEDSAVQDQRAWFPGFT